MTPTHRTPSTSTVRRQVTSRARTKSADADGFVNTDENLPAYGDIFISPTTQASGAAVDRMPAANAQALGESTFAKSLGVNGIPEEATNPATCGMVSGAGAGSVPAGGVDTGTVPSTGVGTDALLMLGGLALLGAAGTVSVRRRTSRQ